MKPSRNTKLGALAVCAAALAAGGAAYAASSHGSSASASPIAGGSLVSSQSGTTTRGDHGPGHGGDDFAAAATYLGLTQAELQTQLQAGKTLGQVAEATSGKSKAGLIAALVAAEKTELAQAVKDGHLTQAQADQIATGLTERFTNLVNGVRPPGGPGGHDGFGDHHGFGGPPPPGGSSSQSVPGTHI